MTVTAAFADTVGSAWLVAVTVACVVTFTLGAVYSPLLLTEPTEAAQLTAVFAVPVTVAVNCCVPPDATVTVAGATLTPIPLLALTGTEYDCVPLSIRGLSVTCTENV